MKIDIEKIINENKMHLRRSAFIFTHQTSDGLFSIVIKKKGASAKRTKQYANGKIVYRKPKQV